MHLACLLLGTLLASHRQALNDGQVIQCPCQDAAFKVHDPAWLEACVFDQLLSVHAAAVTGGTAGGAGACSSRYTQAASWKVGSQALYER